MSLETGEVTVDSGREPTSEEFVDASFRGGIVCGGGIPRLLEMFPESVITPAAKTKKDVYKRQLFKSKNLILKYMWLPILIKAI